MPEQSKISDEYALPRERMVNLLREKYKIADEKVLTAMGRIPRHRFVPTALQAQAYRDNALPIAARQTISQPFIVARMTELLELDDSKKILEIGAGSGYQTAVLAEAAKFVFAIERVSQLVAETSERLTKLGYQNVNLICADGTNGWQKFAPYDGILVAAGSPEIPAPLAAQLKTGGKLVIPVGADQKTQRLIRVTRRAANDFFEEDFGACAFVPLIGEHGWQNRHEEKLAPK